MFKFQKNDLVKVTAGKDKGKQGKVIKIFPQTHRIQVEGVNLYVKHRRASTRQPAEKITITRPLPIGNLALVCPSCHQPTRVTFRVDKQSKKNRLCAKCHQPIGKPKEPTQKTTKSKIPTSKK